MKLTCPPKQNSVTMLSLSDNETLSVVCRYRKSQPGFLYVKPILYIHAIFQRIYYTTLDWSLKSDRLISSHCRINALVLCIDYMVSLYVFHVAHCNHVLHLLYMLVWWYLKKTVSCAMSLVWLVFVGPRHGTAWVCLIWCVKKWLILIDSSMQTTNQKKLTSLWSKGLWSGAWSFVDKYTLSLFMWL